MPQTTAPGEEDRVTLSPSPARKNGQGRGAFIRPCFLFLMVWTTFFFLTDQPPAWSAPRVSDADVNGDAVSVVREKLDQGADPDETDRNGKSLLFMAASRGETRMVRLLLHYGASPDHPDISGKTPLYQAASNGYTEIVRLLLAHGADPNRRDGEGSPLEWAIANKHEKIVEILKHWTRIRRRYLLRKLPLFLNLVPPSQRLRLEKGPLLATGSLPYALPPGLLTAPWKTRHSFVKEATEADIEARTSRFGGNGKEPLWRRRAIEEIAKNLKGYRAVH